VRTPAARRPIHACILLTLLTGACRAAPETAANTPTPVERGRYLVEFGGCNDCHTPKIYAGPVPTLDSTRLLAGHPAGARVPAVPRGVIAPGQWTALTNEHFTVWAGPWGVSYSANLTPDETGLRGWTDSLFIATMRMGKHLGSGRDLLPPMPWPNVALLTDDDLRAMFAYLQSLPPVANAVPAPTPPAGAPR